MIQEELFLSALIQKGLIKQTDAYTLLQEAKNNNFGILKSVSQF